MVDWAGLIPERVQVHTLDLLEQGCPSPYPKGFKSIVESGAAVTVLNRFWISNHKTALKLIDRLGFDFLTYSLRNLRLMHQHSVIPRFRTPVFFENLDATLRRGGNKERTY